MEIFWFFGDFLWLKIFLSCMFGLILVGEIVEKIDLFLFLVSYYLCLLCGVCFVKGECQVK